MKKLSYFLGAVALALLPACRTTMKEMRYQEPKPLTEITPKDRIGEFFMTGKGSLKDIGKPLEEILEEDFSQMFGKKVDIASMQFEDTGHMLLITEAGSTNVIYSKSFLSNMNFKEVKKIEELAEKYGPSMTPSDDAEEKEHRPYSAFMMKSSGFALELLVTQYIQIDPDARGFYEAVLNMSHEAAHTLLFNEMSIVYGFDFLFSYLNLIDNEDIIKIHETACDVIAKKVCERFQENHLEKGSAIYNLFKINKDFNIKVTEPKKGAGTVSKTNGALMFRIKKKYVENGAEVAYDKRYSGDKNITSKLEYIFDEIGPNKFVKLVPYLFNSEDLGKVYKLVKSGETDFRTITKPVRQNVYVVPEQNPGAF